LVLNKFIYFLPPETDVIGSYTSFPFWYGTNALDPIDIEIIKKFNRRSQKRKRDNTTDDIEDD